MVHGHSEVVGYGKIELIVKCEKDTALRRFLVLQRVSSSLLSPVDPSSQTLSGRPKLTVRRHTFNKDPLPPAPQSRSLCHSHLSRIH